MGLFSRLKKAFSFQNQMTLKQRQLPVKRQQRQVKLTHRSVTTGPLRHNSQLARRAQQLNQLRHRCPVQP
ncbi:hypothetical protein M1857_13170 [Lactiplantibacillus plantarum]|nr:hypothetical protein M1857_13170 [Lactiplantibacillus plantarum]